MQTALAHRRLRAERRLFEVHPRLAAAREEAALAAAQHAQLAHDAEAARLRTATCETALAQTAWDEARRRVRCAAASLAAAEGLVAQLEAAQDAAIDDLLGAAT